MLGDAYWYLILYTSIRTLMRNVPSEILTGEGMLERMDDIGGDHAHLFELVAIASVMCTVLLSDRDRAHEET